jgi:multimeric flavodoxin WrbA
MMRVMTILGSPRLDGNTATMLGWVEDELTVRKHDIERVNIVETDLNYCKSCFHCQDFPNEPGCAQEDMGNKIFREMIDCDAILFASPLFMWTYAAPMKTFIDRCLCLVTGYTSSKHKSLIKGKRTGLLVTCAGPLDDNAELIRENHRHIERFALTEPSGELILPFCTTPDKMGAEERGKARFLTHQAF